MHAAEEATSSAADEEADQQKQCFAQSSMEAVPQPMPASQAPTKVRYKIIHITCVRDVLSSNVLMFTACIPNLAAT